MDCQMIELRREELYEKVWSIPIHRLSKEFGMSDVGLAKLCRRHQIPIPGRGYWRRLETGQKPERPRLPKISETMPRMQVIRIIPRANEGADENSDLQTAQDGQGPQAINVLVSEDRPISHPLAIRAKRLLSKERKDGRGILYPEYEFNSPLRVTANALPRALRILDALLFALEQSNITVHWPDGKREKLGVVIFEQRMSISISEAVRQKPPKPESKTRNDTLWRPREWEYEPTGRLRLSVDDLYAVNARHTWEDGKKQRVENCLGHFIAALTVLARILKKHSDERDRQHREWQERCKREEDERMRRADYQRRVEFLKKMATTWHEWNLIRTYIDKVIHHYLKLRPTEEQLMDAWAFVALANHYLRSTDPIIRLPQYLREFEQAAASQSYYGSGYSQGYPR